MLLKSCGTAILLVNTFLFFFQLNCFALHKTQNFSAFFGKKTMIVLICGFSLNGLHMFARKMSVMKESTKFTW